MKYFLFIMLGVLWTTPALAVSPVEVRGGKVNVTKYDDGGWQLRVDGQAYFIKGISFNPVKIGESPDQATMHDWMTYDDDHDGRNDIAFETYVDTNNNGWRDPIEMAVGDFQLLKELGANTIRLYHVPSNNPILGDIYQRNTSTSTQFNHAVNKPLLRTLFNQYGIRVIMGNFFGAWTVGSGADWNEGTDYTNPVHRENIKKSVKAMVLDNKDEPYVLLWLLGNENNLNNGNHCNASSQPKAYATLLEEVAKMIHELDPNHPVAVAEGDNFNTLNYYAKFAPSVDIVAYNAYRGNDGFQSLWEDAKKIFDRPIFINEFGIFAYAHGHEDEQMQSQYLDGNWRDIVRHASSSYVNGNSNTQGNALGGVVFDWVDRWYMDGEPNLHNGGFQYWAVSPDHLDHEEWFGIMGTGGNGSDYLLRHKRLAYTTLQNLWSATVR